MSAECKKCGCDLNYDKRGELFCYFCGFEKAMKLASLLDKLLVCYRVGKPPGKWLDEIGPLREELKDHS